MPNIQQPRIPRQKLTTGQKAADLASSLIGSWTFIIILAILIGSWVYLNILMIIYRWDPYPFILLNFILSTLAAIQAPIILMSQNRETERERLRQQYDYQIDKKAEREIEEIQKQLNKIEKLIKK